MNARSFKVIFSKRLGALVAVGENATAQGKSASGEATHSASGLAGAASSAAQHVGVLKHICLAALLGSSTQAFALDANALPTGAELRHGAATVGTEGATMTINQSTSRATINWQSFNVGSGASVQVHQPSAASVLLNRVVGNEMSQIRGQISANGQVVLVNPNGIVMGPTGHITASAFTASTFGISDANFEAGHMKYERNGSNGKVVHQGHIQTTEAGGYVALIGADVSNEGTIQTRQGAVVLAAAERVSLPSASDMNSVSVPLSRSVRLEIDPAAFGSASVSNSGVIQTEGGQVLLRAAAVVDAVSKVAAAKVTHTGSIDTTGEQGGRVDILADQGHVRVSGNVKANSTDGTAGGDVFIGRDEQTNVLAAVGDASGSNLESKGGFIETSGSFLKVDDISVKAKDWLLDPANIEIVPDTASETGTTLPAAPQSGPVNYEATTTSRVRAKTIADNLNNGTNVTLSTGVDVDPNSTTGDEGNIVVNAAIEKTGDKSAKLTLIANNRIIVNHRIGKKAANSDTGNLDVDMIAHGNRKTAAQGSVVMNNVIDAGKGTVNITATSQTGWEGLIFQGTSGITAGTYTVKGSSLSTAVRFNGGTATFNSSSGDSLIEGNGAGFGGVFASSGNTINLNTTGTATTTLASGESSAGGMRFGFGGGVTVNTNGNVTIGSHNDNSGLFVQANVNVNSGHLTLKGKSVGNGIGLQDGSGTPTQINVNNGSSLTMNGIATGSGNGIDLRPQGAANSITMSGANAGQRGTLNLIGDSNTGAGIYTNFAAITSDGGNINLTGTSQGNGLVHDGLIRSGDASSGGVVTLIGNSTGTASSRLGVNLSTGTVQGGAVIVEGSSRSSAQGVYTSANSTIKSTTSDVSIKGQSNTGTATHLQGVVTGQSGVSITGETNGATANARSVLIENTITAVTGNITVTGEINNTDINQRAITLAGAASKLDARNGNIDLKTDSIFINSALGNNTAAMISAAGNSKGIVSINTTTASKTVVLGGTDSNTQLGIDSGEMGKIAANKLVIGNADRTGNINVTGASTTNSDLELRTQGSIAINQALTVGTSGTKNLTLNAGVSVTQTEAGIISADKVHITGTQAAVTLDTAVNQINQLTASVKSLHFKNGKVLQLGADNVGITASEKIKIETTAGNLNLNQAVTTTAQNDVDALILISESAKDAGESDGGNILKESNGSVSVGNGSTAKLFTGSIGNSTGMQDLAGGSGSGQYRYNSDETDQNFTKALDAKNGTNNGVNVIYREAPSLTLSINNTEKTYDGQAFSLSAASAFASGTLANGDTATAAATFGGTAQNAVNAGTYTITGVTNASKPNESALGYKVTYTNNATNPSSPAQLTVKKKDVTLDSLTADNKTYDGNTNASITAGTISGTVGTETLAISGAGSFDTKNAGTGKTVTVTDVTTLTKANGDNGGDWNNYNLTTSGSMSTNADIARKTLTIRDVSVNDKAYDGTNAAQVNNPGSLDGLVGDETLGHTTTANFRDFLSVGPGKIVNIDVALADGTGQASNYEVEPATVTASITGAVEPIDPPTPVVPVVPPTNNNVVVTVAAASNNFVLAGAEGQCSADTLEQCECETATTSAGAAIDGIQICYEPKGRAAGAPL